MYTYQVKMTIGQTGEGWSKDIYNAHADEPEEAIAKAKKQAHKLKRVHKGDIIKITSVVRLDGEAAE